MRRASVLRLLPISAVWFFCLGGLGLFFPFYSLYLRENAGLSGTQVGAVLAVLPAVGILAQPLWGSAADRTGARGRVLVVLALGASIGYSSIVLGQGFASLLLLTAVLACFSTPLIPTSVAVTLALTRDRGPHAFGLVRVWGTIGFFVAVASFPALLHGYQQRAGLVPVPGGPAEPGFELMLPLTGALVLLGGIAALAIPPGGALSLRAAAGDWRQLLRHRPYVRLLTFTLTAYFMLQGPMWFFPVYVRAHNGTLEAVSQLWVLMLIPEIPLIALSGAGLQRLGARGLLALGVIAGGVRWTVCGLAPGSDWIFAAQLLHGVVVTGLVIGAPLYVDAAVPERLRSTGQGVLAMAGLSLGGISSNLATGWLLEHFGPDAPYIAGGVGALVLGILVPLWLPPARRPAGEVTVLPGRYDPG
ncbi:MAG TPA: MFS transporter [Myxococcota bacterium]